LRGSKGDLMAAPLEESKVHPVTDSVVQPDYDALAHESRISFELVKARRRAGLSQAELAERLGTIPSAVARMESGQRMPSIRMLLRIAKATGNRVQLRFVPQ
jgi:ribosome-binding protein aMBF1 (putative translation factor)